MGYYTNYQLSWEPQKTAVTEWPPCQHKPSTDVKFCPECGVQNVNVVLDEKIAQYIKSNDEMDYCLTEEGETNQAGKWYENEKDMREMSRVFRDVVFTLCGNGEESEDIWKKYFLNGKCQIEKARIVIDNFDKSKLK